MFAKLDRLTRNVDLLRSLVISGVDLVFCDLPGVPPGPMGRFLLTQMAAVAELGNPNGARALRGKQTGNAEAVTKIKEKAKRRATNLKGIIEGIKHAGMTRVRAISEGLNRYSVPEPRALICKSQFSRFAGTT